MLLPASSEAIAFNRLSHARVCWALNRAGIDHLVLKGVSTADLLSSDRASADVDVLVSPPDVDAAVAVILGLGYEEPLHGSAAGEGAAHSRTLRSPDGPEVDVHVHFPGLDTDPALAWSVARARSVTLVVAGHALQVPDAVMRVLILALAAARDGRGSRAASDFATGLGQVNASALRALADSLAAAGPLRAGVWTLEDPAPAEAALGLEDVEVSDKWKLMSAGATPTERKWLELREAGWAQRVRILARELVPTRAFMAFTDPRSTECRRALAAAHWRRWMRLGREVPAARRKVRQQTREGRN